ncbi:sensor histidine kinase [Vibrio cionasavignyae]|uniref:sensor histidine kinase n=1 Tax=Vibrio cionasavignyae TaxID=2910252 RepID=UPI003D0C8B5E
MRYKWIITVVVVMLIGLFYSTSREVSRQWLSNQTQILVQERLLDYIGEVRRTLKRFYHLPYLVTNNPRTIALVAGDLALKQSVEDELFQLDKAANTKGWLILSATGEALASSVAGERFSLSDRQAIAQQIHSQGERVSLVSKTKGSTPFYYLTAPIFIGLDIAGIAVVQIDLSLLTEQIITSSDVITFQNQQDQFFLSSSTQYGADWLNDSSHHIVQNAELLYDNTRIKTWQLTNSQTISADSYLAHTVKLDDLNWKISYLTPLKPMQQTINVVGWSTITVLLFVTLLIIIFFQRHQKQQSKQQIQSILEESQQRLTQMINKTHVGLMVIDDHGLLFDVNPMAKRQFCLPDRHSKAIHAWELFDAGNPNSTTLKLLKNLAIHKEHTELSAVDTMAKRSDGTLFPVLFSLTLFPWHGQPFFLATVIDISKRKTAEQALQQANQALEKRVEERTQALEQAQHELVQASKMAALGRMSSAITHELNQPLTGLRTLLTTNELLMERNEYEMMRANHTLIQTLIDRMANMTRQLKSFAYSKPELLNPVSLSEALEETLRIYQSKLATIDVRVRAPEVLPTILGEEQRLRQVLGNLISNAIDALSDTKQPILTIAISKVNTMIEIRIIDNGCGVNPSSIDAIFEPFHTSKKIGDGLGLGLSITANNMRDMNGSISADNNAQHGMTFTLMLPEANV